MNAGEVERRLEVGVYPKRDLTIVRGQGAVLWDEAGRQYIDCTAGVGVANVGHANPEVAAAIAEQARTLVTCPEIFHNDVRARLLQALLDVAPSGLVRAFLCNSGTECVEAAIKFARHATGRSRFVCAMRGFHGRTLGALSATFKYREPFEPLLAGFDFVPFNNRERLEAALTDETAAVLVELVQGEGGVRPADADYVAALERSCRARGILVIVDEVQTGFCRTGRMFACEHFDLRPDMLCLAKAIAGGVPMGAVLCGPGIEPGVGVHGSTFGGNPLACAAALAAIEFMRSHRLQDQAREKGAHFRRRFDRRKLDAVRAVRQIGLMIGIELKEKATPHLASLMDRGVLALPAGPTVIRLLPPLTIGYEELDSVVDALHEVLGG